MGQEGEEKEMYFCENVNCRTEVETKTIDGQRVCSDCEHPTVRPVKKTEQPVHHEEQMQPIQAAGPPTQKTG